MIADLTGCLAGLTKTKMRFGERPGCRLIDPLAGPGRAARGPRRAVGLLRTSPGRKSRAGAPKKVSCCRLDACVGFTMR